MFIQSLIIRHRSPPPLSHISLDGFLPTYAYLELVTDLFRYFRLTPSHLKASSLIQLKYVKFQNVNSVTVSSHQIFLLKFH